MAKQVLRRPLKVEGVHSVDETLSAGTVIEATDRHRHVTHDLVCRIVIANGVEYAAYQAAIDEAVRD